MKELQILSPDGNSRAVPLEGQRLSLGRSSTVELSYPDDSGLSRQHLVLEREGEEWAINDLGSKNGTLLNGARLTARTALKSGDRIAAGHLIIIYDGTSQRTSRPVVVFDAKADEELQTHSSTVVTDLGDVIKHDSTPGDPAGGAANHVSALIRAGNELSGHRPLPELFRFILDLSIQTVSASRGVLMTLEDGELVVRANKGEGFRISTAVRDRVLNTGVSVLVRDTSMDDAFRERRSIVEQNIRTLMAVPLQARDQIIGIIYVDSPPMIREFTKDDLNLLTVMANVAAIRIEQTRFAEVEQARQLMARDLEQAAEIQQGFLPAIAPKVRGLDLAGHNAPCRTVGGDYYDFFPYGSSRVAMVLGDVSGKGMPASLLMMGLQARVQVLIEEPKSLAEVMTKLNRITAANCPANRFITLFFCILDGDTGELIYCNAGHNPPVLVRADGTYELLSGGGPVIGILPHIDYQEFRARLSEGDALVIYSDGVTEAANPNDEELETEGLAEVVKKYRAAEAPTIVKEINKAVAVYTAGAPQADDITVIVARRVAG
ncbi:MAG TPA: SpoIIE family protein phosphatase [Bryobacteraceae bacterium]|jgi:serine phosphatase RsbU (regulator of sigma subunit)|nr:SpoIIE family protein phosphatase [Bryobacteraceae bacterium]